MMDVEEPELTYGSFDLDEKEYFVIINQNGEIVELSNEDNINHHELVNSLKNQLINLDNEIVNLPYFKLDDNGDLEGMYVRNNIGVEKEIDLDLINTWTREE